MNADKPLAGLPDMEKALKREMLGEEDRPTAPPPSDRLSLHSVDIGDVGKTLRELVVEVETGAAPPLTEEDIKMLDDYLIKGYAEHEFNLSPTFIVKFRTPIGESEITADRMLAGAGRNTTHMGLLRLMNILSLARYIYTYGGKHLFTLPEDVNPDQSFRSREDIIDESMGSLRRLDAHIVDRMIDELQKFQSRLRRLLSHEGLLNF